MIGSAYKPPDETIHIKYQYYKQACNISNRGRSVQRYFVDTVGVAKICALVLCCAHFFMGRRYRKPTSKERLQRNGECCTGKEVRPSDAKDAVARVVIMESEPAALDRVYAVQGALESIFVMRVEDIWSVLQT